VDGQLIANNSLLTTTSETTPNYGSPTYVTFGARNGGASQYMQGSLDDIHLYNRPLNATEVKALHEGNPSQKSLFQPAIQLRAEVIKLRFQLMELPVLQNINGK